MGGSSPQNCSGNRFAFPVIGSVGQGAGRLAVDEPSFCQTAAKYRRLLSLDENPDDCGHFWLTLF